MKFTSLHDAENAYNHLASETETMLGMVAGMTTILLSLIAKHHDKDQLQLHLTYLREKTDAGMIFDTLTQAEREIALTYVEQLRQFGN